jgi:hypothetical protein
MKKISFILIALLFTNFFYAQKKRVTISESKIGGLSNSYTKSINLETKDTIYSVFSGFQYIIYYQSIRKKQIKKTIK